MQKNPMLSFSFLTTTVTDLWVQSLSGVHSHKLFLDILWYPRHKRAGSLPISIQSPFWLPHLILPIWCWTMPHVSLLKWQGEWNILPVHVMVRQKFLHSLMLAFTLDPLTCTNGGIEKICYLYLGFPFLLYYCMPSCESLKTTSHSTWNIKYVT